MSVPVVYDLVFVISGFVMAMIVGRPGAFDGREFWIRSHCQGLCQPIG